MDRGTKITLIIVALVAILAFSQSLTGGRLTDLVSNKTKAAAAANAASASKGHEAKDFVLPKPVGNPAALVKVRVYVTSDNTCDHSTVDAMDKLGAKYGQRIYIDYADLLNAKVKAEADRLKIGCKSGLTINGKSRFFLPKRGLSGTIMLDGPVGQKNYKAEDLEAVVDYLLAQKPGAGEDQKDTTDKS
jgi:hypothetical protein